MAKRNASNELTDRNWDHEEEPEDAGVFSQASNDILKQREMKIAKRKSPCDSAGSGAFSAFGGFGNKDLSKPLPISSNLFASKQTVSNGLTFSKTVNSNQTKSTYYHSVKSLNNSLLSWVQQHVENDPACILTPIFNDYNKHLEDIKKNNNNDESKETVVVKETDGDSDPEIVINFQVKQKESPVKDPGKTSIFGSSGVSGFTFTSANSTTNSVSSFGGTSGFSFATNKLPTETATTSTSATNDGEEEYVPPTVETQEIIEDGSVYTKRCKLFYQKDGNWKDRGVGNIHLKVLDDGKAQIIVRADTNLGNILLNIMLSAAMPTKRQGKNNVWIVCVPNPPVDPKDDSQKPVPMLIRVKTGEEADELLSKLEELKK